MVAQTTILKTLTGCFIACCFFVFSPDVSAQREAVPTDEAIIAQGEQLWGEYVCNTCHKVNEKLVGPAMAGVYDRRELDWIYSWVKNSTRLIQSGDEQAVALYNEYNQLQMPSYDLSDDQILSILAYIRDYEENPPVAAAPVATEEGAAASSQGGIPAQYLNIIVGVLIVILILILIVLVLIMSVVKKYLQDKKDLDEADAEVVSESFNVMAFFRSPTVIGIITFLVIALASKNVIHLSMWSCVSLFLKTSYFPTSLGCIDFCMKQPL